MIPQVFIVPIYDYLPFPGVANFHMPLITADMEIEFSAP